MSTFLLLLLLSFNLINLKRNTCVKHTYKWCDCCSVSIVFELSNRNTHTHTHTQTQSSKLNVVDISILKREKHRRFWANHLSWTNKRASERARKNEWKMIQIAMRCVMAVYPSLSLFLSFSLSSYCCFWFSFSFCVSVLNFYKLFSVCLVTEPILYSNSSAKNADRKLSCPQASYRSPFIYNCVCVFIS